MKRMLWLLCAVALLFSYVALADEATEITFQHIPWGSSVATISDWISQSGYKTPTWQGDNYFAFFPLNDGANSVLKPDGQLADYKELKSYQGALKHWSGINDMLCSEFKIAGYAVRNSECVFLYDGAATKLITVWLDLNYDSIGKQEFMADMMTKLHSVYGTGNIDNDTRYFKLGANNTAVLFHDGYLVYGDVSAFSALENMVKPVHISIPDSSNTKGL